MRKGYLYIALTTLLFSSMEIALKSVADLFDPAQMTLLRFLVGGLFLLPFALRALRRRGLSLSPRDFAFFALTGLICVVVSMNLYQTAIQYSKASIVAILFSCNPVFVVALAAVILKERIRGFTIVSMIVSVAGMVAIMNPLRMSSGALGIILTLLSAVAFALYAVIGKTRSLRYGGLVTTSMSFLLGSAEMLVLVLAGRIPAVASLLRFVGLSVFAQVPLVRGLGLSTLPVFLYISFCVTGLGYTFYFLAIEETSAAMAAIVFYIKPALAPLLALLILGESIAPTTLLGMLLIVVGSAISFVGNGKARAPR